MAIYGYARVSTPQQSIDRQIRNIREYCPEVTILKEAWTGTTLNRPEWAKLMKRIAPGDTIIFDSVSRMSRNAEDGFSEYQTLFERNVNLVFLREPHINTTTYRCALDQSISATGNAIADEFIAATNRVLLMLAKEQIQLAFDQAQKEVMDLRQRTREGIETARLAGKQIGTVPGSKLNVKKRGPAKAQIQRYSSAFNGTLTDTECMKLVGLSRNTYYKYKREIMEGNLQ